MDFYTLVHSTVSFCLNSAMADVVNETQRNDVICNLQVATNRWNWQMSKPRRHFAEKSISMSSNPRGAIFTTRPVDFSNDQFSRSISRVPLKMHLANGSVMRFFLFHEFLSLFHSAFLGSLRSLALIARDCSKL